jgi:hypothetical protein
MAPPLPNSARGDRLISAKPQGASTRSPGLAVLLSILPVTTAYALSLSHPAPLPKPFEVCERRQDQSNRSNNHKAVSLFDEYIAFVKRLNGRAIASKEYVQCYVIS